MYWYRLKIKWDYKKIIHQSSCHPMLYIPGKKRQETKISSLVAVECPKYWNKYSTVGVKAKGKWFNYFRHLNIVTEEINHSSPPKIGGGRGHCIPRTATPSSSDFWELLTVTVNDRVYIWQRCTPELSGPCQEPVICSGAIRTPSSQHQVHGLVTHFGEFVCELRNVTIMVNSN
jgi:hypothetical protein